MPTVDQDKRATLIVDGEEFTDAASYQIESDLVTPADAFSFRFPNRLGKMATRVFPGSTVQVLLDGRVQMTGIVDQVTVSTDKAGSWVDISGRDRFQFLVDCSIDPGRFAAEDLKSIAEKLTDRWTFDWVAQNQTNQSKLIVGAEAKLARTRRQEQKARQAAEAANKNAVLLDAVRKVNASALGVEGQPSVIQTRYKIYQEIQGNYESLMSQANNEAVNLQRIRATKYESVKVEPGETAIEVLSRLAQKSRFLVWSAADGTGIIGRPNYSQPPIYAIRLYPSSDSRCAQNNVISANIVRDFSQRFSVVTVEGTAANTSKKKGRKSFARAQAFDDEVKRDRPLIITDGDLKSQAEAEKRAADEVGKRIFESVQIEYKLRGHFNMGIPWQIDTICDVDDTVSGLSGPFYVMKRRFEGDERSTHTSVTLRTPGVWLAS